MTMKKTLIWIAAIGLMIFLFSCCFIQDTVSYIQSADDIINTVYVMGIVGFVAGWLLTHNR